MFILTLVAIEIASLLGAPDPWCKAMVTFAVIKLITDAVSK